MSKSLPLASILLVSYNQESVIKEAFESLLAQTYESLEIIVADDFSNDKTKSILKNIAANYKGKIKIIFHESEENLGVCGNINRSIRLCSGQMIFLAAGDDVSLPDRCKKVMDRWLQLDKKPDLIASDAFDFSYDGVILGNKKIDLLEKYQSPIDWIKSPPYFFGSTFSLSSRLVKDFPPIDPKMLAEDHVLVFRAIISGGAVTISEPLVKHRRGGVTKREYQSLSEKIKKLKIGYLDKYRYINQILSDAKDHPDFKLLVKHFEVQQKECELANQLFCLNKPIDKIMKCFLFDGPSIFFKAKILTYSTFPWLLKPIFEIKFLFKKY